MTHPFDRPPKDNRGNVIHTCLVINMIFAVCGLALLHWWRFG